MTFAVFVNEPWPEPFIFVPQNSSVLVNCRANSTSASWSIKLGSDNPSGTSFSFSGSQVWLNINGVYDLTQTERETIVLTLLINNTAKNNRTVIRCIHHEYIPPKTVLSTLYVLGKFNAWRTIRLSLRPSCYFCVLDLNKCIDILSYSIRAIHVNNKCITY